MHPRPIHNRAPHCGCRIPRVEAPAPRAGLSRDSAQELKGQNKRANGPETTPSAFSMMADGTYFPTLLPIVLPMSTPGMLHPTTLQTGVAASA